MNLGLPELIVVAVLVLAIAFLGWLLVRRRRN
jgi:LPXTG-motif cell wall-anchored protein